MVKSQKVTHVYTWITGHSSSHKLYQCSCSGISCICGTSLLKQFFKYLNSNITLFRHYTPLCSRPQSGNDFPLPNTPFGVTFPVSGSMAIEVFYSVI